LRYKCAPFKVNAHYIHLKKENESPFLQSKSSDFSKNNLNDVKIQIFFHFQVHTTIKILNSKNMGLGKINLNIKMEFRNLKNFERFFPA
jgi:uncharacterized protein YehS (DUF1456 family)